VARKGRIKEVRELLWIKPRKRITSLLAKKSRRPNIRGKCKNENLVSGNISKNSDEGATPRALQREDSVCQNARTYPEKKKKKKTKQLDDAPKKEKSRIAVKGKARYRGGTVPNAHQKKMLWKTAAKRQELLLELRKKNPHCISFASSTNGQKEREDDAALEKEKFRED